MEKSPYLHFSAVEFEKCVPRCKFYDMDAAFMKKLERCREIAAVPFYLNSAFRSGAWEISHGRNGNSMHTLGRAVDIRCSSNQDRLKIIKAALEVGFVRIGVGPNFIHLDDSTLNPCIWTYYSK